MTLAPMQKYNFVKKLGSGTQGEVYLCKDQENNNFVALKSIVVPYNTEQTFEFGTSLSDTPEAIDKKKTSIERKKSQTKTFTMSLTSATTITTTATATTRSRSSSKKSIITQEISPTATQIQKSEVMTEVKITSLSPDQVEKNQKLEPLSPRSRGNPSLHKILDEVSWACKQDHPHIAKHCDYFVEKIQSFPMDETRVFVVMEYCNVGDLHSFICNLRQENCILPIKVVSKWTQQLIKVMDYLHDRNIAHRDIKAENVLLTFPSDTPEVVTPLSDIKELRKNLDRIIIKLGDFGCRREWNDTLMKSFKGTVYYMSPEVLNREYYDESSDIWSLGVLVYQLLTMKETAHLPNFKEKLQNNVYFIRNQFNDSTKEVKKIAEICYMCIKLDPSERPTTKELLNFLEDPRRIAYRKSARLKELISLNETDNVLNEIRSNIGREFWKSNQWENKIFVPWLEFLNAYQKYNNWKKIDKHVLRGLKRLLCCKGTSVTYTNFDEAISRAGFPFDVTLISTIDKYTQFDDEEKSFSQNDDAKTKYLNMIAQQNGSFIDPVKQQALRTEEYCFPIPCTTDEGKTLSCTITHLLRDCGSSRCMLVGPAASGKSFLLRLLALRLANKCIESEANSKIPILVPISTLMNMGKTNLLDFRVRLIRASADSLLNKNLRYSNDIEEFLLNAIKQRNTLLLFDGLDESSTQGRSLIEQDIIDLCEQLPGCSMIISSRMDKSLYSRNMNRLKFETIELLPITQETQIQVIKKRGADKTQLIQHIQSGKLIDLAKNPLLLSLLINSYVDLDRPISTEFELFDAALELMIEVYFLKKQCKVNFKEREVMKNEIREFLTALAIQLHKHRKRDFLPANKVIKNMKDKKFILSLQKLQTDIEAGFFPLIVPLNDMFRFSLFCFQEYLTAQEWANESSNSDLRRIAVSIFSPSKKKIDYNENFVKEKFLDPWYRQTLLLTAMMMTRKEFKNFVKWVLKNFTKHCELIDLVLLQMINARSKDTKGDDKEIKMREELYSLIENRKKISHFIEGFNSKSKILRKSIAKTVMETWENIEDFREIANLALNKTKEGQCCKEVVQVLGIKNHHIVTNSLVLELISNIGNEFQKFETPDLKKPKLKRSKTTIFKSGAIDLSSLMSISPNVSILEDDVKASSILSLAYLLGPRPSDDPQKLKAISMICSYHGNSSSVIKTAIAKALRKLFIPGNEIIKQCILSLLKFVIKSKEDADMKLLKELIKSCGCIYEGTNDSEIIEKLTSLLGHPTWTITRVILDSVQLILQDHQKLEAFIKKLSDMYPYPLWILYFSNLQVPSSDHLDMKVLFMVHTIQNTSEKRILRNLSLSLLDKYCNDVGKLPNYRYLILKIVVNLSDTLLNETSPSVKVEILNTLNSYVKFFGCTGWNEWENDAYHIYQLLLHTGLNLIIHDANPLVREGAANMFCSLICETPNEFGSNESLQQKLSNVMEICIANEQPNDKHILKALCAVCGIEELVELFVGMATKKSYRVIIFEELVRKISFIRKSDPSWKLGNTEFAALQSHSSEEAYNIIREACQ